MTEYDYSPEAYERYLATQQRISNWVATTEGYRNEYGNALTVPPPQTGSSSQPRGQHLDHPQSLRSSHSQYLQNPPHSQSRFTSSCRHSASAVDLQSQCLQNSCHDTAYRSSAPFAVSSQIQHPRTVSQHGGPSTSVHTVPSQQRDTRTTKTSTTYVAVSHPPSQHRDTHPTKMSTSYASVSHPQKHLVPSQHASIQPEVYAQHLHDGNVVSQRSVTSASSPQKAPLRHHASTPQLEIATRQAPTYVLTIPPSDGPTYVYAPSGWVPSAGLVIVPSKGQGTSIVISPPATHGHIPVPQIQHKGHTQPMTPGAVDSPSVTLQTSPHASSSQAPYPPVAYVPVPVVIIERERRSKNVGVKKSKKKDKRNRSKARS